jgi:hypothetical protein
MLLLILTTKIIDFNIKWFYLMRRLVVNDIFFQKILAQMTCFWPQVYFSKHIENIFHNQIIP